MKLPGPLVAAVEAAVGPFRVAGGVGGGCIQPAVRLETAGGPLFLKYGSGSAPGFFAAEALGLERLRASATSLRVPEVVSFRDAGGDGDHGWIVMEWMEPARRGADFGVRLAEGLAELHAAGPGEWGWERPGFIGTLVQDNGPLPGWAEFWRRRRLEPQLALACKRGAVPGGEEAWEVLFARLPALLAPAQVDGPSLLHGDLWGGNILATAGGAPAIVDPAAYHGHREVDLAMSELFGGQDESFYRRYDEIRPLQPRYREVRRGIYQLYYLLVHVNLFGEGYVPSTAATLRSVLAATT